jgi:hypothetical protein
MAVPPFTTATIRIHLMDGGRHPVTEDLEALVRIFDSHRRLVASSFVTGPQAIFPNLPLAENGAERFTVLAHARGYRDGLLFPVRPVRNMLADVALLLVPENGLFLFESPDLLESGHPSIRRMLGPEQRQALYQLNPRHLAGLLNLCAAMETLPLPDESFSTPLHLDWQPVWDLLTPERVWAWVDLRFLEILRKAACLRSFAVELHPETRSSGIAGHAGPATSSWREVRFPAGNLRFTFHEHDRRTLDLLNPLGDTRSVDCVLVEAEIDCWGDLLSLGLAEAVPPAAQREKSSVEMAYQLRWMMHRLERLPEFDPPYRIE